MNLHVPGVTVIQEEEEGVDEKLPAGEIRERAGSA